MAEQDSAPRIDLDQVVRIVSSYVQRHQYSGREARIRAGMQADQSAEMI